VPAYPVLPLKNTVVFPRVLIPLAVGRPRSLQLLTDLTPGDRIIAVAAQLESDASAASGRDAMRFKALASTLKGRAAKLRS